MDQTISDDGEAKELLDAQAHVWKYTVNYITSMSLKCAVELGIPDIISNHAKPLPLSELVQALSIPQAKSTYLYRLMRILVHSGFFDVQKTLQHEEGYLLTPSSKLLLKNHEKNLSPFLLLLTDPFLVTPFHFMSSWFRGTDPSAFVSGHGMDIWNYLSRHSDVGKSFNAGMASDSEFVMQLVLENHREVFKGFGTLVDVGGATGTVAKAISKAFPSMKCTILDLPHIVSKMKGDENIEFVGGDMFEAIPSADIILLKWVMHAFEDEECMKILKRCREATPEDNGKVIIIDIVIDEDKGNHGPVESQLCFDMLMMVVATGKERSEAQWKKLFLDAGFSSYKITHGIGLRSIIEVFP